MDFLIAILLGIVQGAAAFLPVSASGHLIVLERLTGISIPALTFHVFLRAGASVAAVLVFRDDLAGALSELSAVLFRSFRRDARKEAAGTQKPSGRSRESRTLALLVIPTIPTAALGLIGSPAVRTLSSSTFGAGIGMLITGMLLIVTDRVAPKRDTLRDLHRNELLMIGAFQCFSVFPGISQFAAVLCAGIFVGLGRKNAIRLACLLSVPYSVCALVFEILRAQIIGTFTAQGFGICAVGFAAAAVTATLLIRFELQLVRRTRLTVFAEECLAVGVLAIVLTFVMV